MGRLFIAAFRSCFVKRNFRFYIAMFGAKASTVLLKALGRKASFFPGEVALKICPDFAARVEKPETVICVTGTNGKTTTCNMIIDALEKNGYEVLNNRAGANVNSGVIAALANGSTMGGRAKYKIAVFEVDERSSQLIYPRLEPTYVVCTNLFRDSIHRNAHPEFIFNFIQKSLPESTHLILNADDLISSQLGCEANPRTYFSIDRLPTDKAESVNLINDVRICPKCHKKLHYNYVRYHHIGNATCEHCGFSSPEADYHAALDFEAGTLQMATPTGAESYPMVSTSVLNEYNQVTAIATLRAIGLSFDQVSAGFADAQIVESRFSSRKIGNTEVISHLAKGQNPVACSCVFEFVGSEPGRKEVILMLDDVFDRKDSSEIMTWIYDCDFEFLNTPEIVNIVVAGVRREDYKLRLLMAGVPEERIRCVASETEAADQLIYKGTDKIFVLYELYAVDEALELRDQICEAVKKQEAANE